MPLPAVPPQACVESTAVRVIVEALSEVTVLPYWSSNATIGLVAKSTLVIAVADGCVMNANLFFAPATSVRVP